MKTKQTTPYHTHNGTNEMHGMCEETSVVDTVMGLSGCMVNNNFILSRMINNMASLG